MRLSGVGVWSGALLRHEDRGAVGDAAAELEDLGYTALWIPEGASAPIFEACGEVLDATRRIPVATGIMNVWSREPEEAAAGHAGLTERHPGRFLLGLGISHAPMIEGYRKPLAKMSGHLDGLDAAQPAVPRDERIIAALGPKMLALAGERSIGTHPYFTPAEHTAAAREALGADAVVAPELSVVLEGDRDRAHAIARDYIALYLKLPNYTNNLLRHGFTEDDLRDGGSDRLVDEITPWGDVDAIAAAVRRHLDAGADHVCIQVLTDGDRRSVLPREQWRELAPALTG
jgi:probable F420-dependent oxidoreductase